MIVSVSAIIPCFNSRETIQRALQSVVDQTVQILEIICIDDDSTDDTVSIIRKFAQENLTIPIQVIENATNSGAGYSRNQAWDLAKGDYVAFLDSDDAWLKNKIFTQYSWMNSHPEVSVSGHTHIIFNNDDITIPAIDENNLAVTYVSKLFMLMRSPFITPSIMVKRSVSHRFKFDKRYCEDYLLLAEMIMNDRKVVKINIPLVLLFKEAYGVSGLSGNTREMLAGEIEVYNILVKNSNLSIIYSYLLIFWSLIKYTRRAMIIHFR